MWEIFLALALALGAYLLYQNGYMTISAKSAVVFVGTIRGKENCHGEFSSCTGYMKRIMKFPENGIYAFTLNAGLEKGDITVTLLDGHRSPVLRLDRSRPEGEVSVERNTRYCLRFDFASATGSYDLGWKR